MCGGKKGEKKGGGGKGEKGGEDQPKIWETSSRRARMPKNRPWRDRCRPCNQKGGRRSLFVIKKVAAGPFLITSLLTRFFYKPSGFHSVRAFSFFEAFTAPPDPLRPPTAPPTAPKLLRTTSNHIASPHLDLRTTPKPPQHHPQTTYLPHPLFTHTRSQLEPHQRSRFRPPLIHTGEHLLPPPHQLSHAQTTLSPTAQPRLRRTPPPPPTPLFSPLRTQTHFPSQLNPPNYPRSAPPETFSVAKPSSSHRESFLPPYTSPGVRVQKLA